MGSFSLKRCWGSPREIAYLWGRAPWLVHDLSWRKCFSTWCFFYSNRLPAKSRNSVVTMVGEFQTICCFFPPWWSRWLRWSFDWCFSTWLETVQRGNHFYAGLVGRPEHKARWFFGKCRKLGRLVTRILWVTKECRAFGPNTNCFWVSSLSV